MGLRGAELQNFVKDQQDLEREEREAKTGQREGGRAIGKDEAI